MTHIRENNNIELFKTDKNEENLTQPVVQRNILNQVFVFVSL